MALHTPLCDLLGIRHPILLAGMAGGPTTPELVAAVSEAGGLGTFGLSGMTLDAARQALRAAMSLTRAPIGINVLLPEPTPPNVSDDEHREALAPIRRRLGLPENPEPPPTTAKPLDLVAMAIEEGVTVITTGLGDPAPVAPITRDAGLPLIAMVATVDDARTAAASGADAIVAQGGEAGGHRSNFAVPDPEHPVMVGTMALVPQVVDAVDVPVIATGGIMDGRGLVAALALGAQAAQFGTRFLFAAESGANAAYRARLASARDTDARIITNFSGRPARGLPNTLLEELEAAGAPNLGYPRQGRALADLRRDSVARGVADRVSTWSGQAAPLGVVDQPAGEIVVEIMKQAHEVAGNLTAG